MKVWGRPELVVLRRGTAAEALIHGCKNAVKGEQTSMNSNHCTKSPCDYCNSKNVAS